MLLKVGQGFFTQNHLQLEKTLKTFFLLWLVEEEISKMLGTEQLRTECSLQYEQLKQVWERTLISIAKYS